MTRIEPRHRPRYTDVERATILTLKSRCRLSNKALASFFLLDPGTLSEWTADVDRPERRRKPLVETLPDQDAAIAALADHLPDLPPRLRHTVDQTLAAIAAKILLRRPRLRRSRMRQTPISPAPRKRRLSPIRARYPNHYWTADLTTIELVRPFHLVTLMDLHSRDVLAWELFAGQPASCDVEELFEDAARRHGKPKHFVSDQGGQFMGDALGTALAAKGVDHRRGAVGQHGSIAIIERLWKTVKECLDLQTVRPSVPAILHERIARIVDYYNTKRPHQSLGNATPAEVYAGQLSLAADPKPAPRGWPGEPRPAPPFVIRHAFPDERRLPFLERTA
jgi:transposase InsO family protein